MKLLLVLCSFIISFSLFAEDISVSLAPLNSSPLQAAQSGGFRPLVDEPFLILFSIPYKGDQTPDYPEFLPQGLEVRQRSEAANTVSLSRGQMIKRTVYSYEVVSSQKGTVWLRDISVRVDGKVKKLPSKSIQIVAERPRPKDIFVVAEVDKDKIYVGEGFNIDYYVYANRTKAVIDDGRRSKDPTFSNIIKRLKAITATREMVNLEGVPYERIQIYSLRAYGENPGVADIGPLTFEAMYRTSNFGPVYSRKITSERKKINILPLPGTIPSNFSGLIGPHTFEVSQPRTRFIVNEPIEFTVRVSGDGALEKFSLPALLNHPELESFDTRSELSIDPDQVRATKKFELTYLARAPLKLPAKEITWSYFDKETEKFVDVSYSLPEIEIAGAASATQVNNQNTSATASETPAAPVIPKVDKRALLDSLVAPDFASGPGMVDYWRYLNMGLTLLTIVVFLSGWIVRPKQYKIDPRINKLVKEIRKDGFSYSRLHHLLLFLTDQQETSSLREILQDSVLPADTRDYFLRALNEVERANYGSGDSSSISFQAKHFNQLMEVLKK